MPLDPLNEAKIQEQMDAFLTAVVARNKASALVTLRRLLRTLLQAQLFGVSGEEQDPENRTRGT